MVKNFEPHTIIWTKEKILRLWGYITSNSAYESLYFSNKYGASIIEYVEKFIPLKGEILDFGCGKGYLLMELMKKGIYCNGADISKESLDFVKEKSKNNEFVKGLIVINKIPSKIDSERFDIIFLIETLEHLLEEERDIVIDEIKRIMRKNGKIIITTPNNENLEESNILCPECGCIFNRKEHLKSWSEKFLCEYMEKKGFSKEMCRSLSFEEKEKNIVTRSKKAIKNTLIKLRLFGMDKKEYPNIIYIGTKK